VLAEGDLAPDFTLRDQHGESLTVSDLQGQTVVLYFYPRADTPGCTTQACGVRDHSADYERTGARVLGVSPDRVSAIAQFDDKYGLGFTLLADEDHAVADAYGTWVEKTKDDSTYWGVERTTFVIDPEGRIARILPRVSPETHDDEVLAALEELGAPRT
jgi:thioredoxin-dependent peroxiredoxin